MASPGKVWSVLRDDGPRELARRGLAYGARALGPEPSPAPPPTPPRPTSTASTVRFAEATKFFRARQASYNRLADAIAPHLPADGVLFDVGANIGYFSKVVGRRNGFRGVAHLFEPIPHLAQLCFQSLAKAEFSYSVHLFGLSDADGHADIFIDPHGNFGWNTMIGQQAHGMTPLRIAIRRFDGIGLSVVPDLVKIDVEGAEYLVLRGLLPSIRSWETKPPILCEVGWGADGHPAWIEELAVLTELRELGYRATSLDGDPIDVETIAETTDVLFLPA